jgi:hypothetical protein
MIVDRDETIAELRRSEFDSRTELRRKLLTGEPTGPTRAAIVEFSKQLQAEVARVRLDMEARAEAKRAIRETGRRQMAARLASEAQAEIAKRMAPIVLPAPITELK